MNPDFSNTSKQTNNYYKFNQQSAGGYGSSMQNQFNPQGGNNYPNNAYGGYLPEQYQNVYYNPYSYQQGQGAGQNAYPYNYNFQGQQLQQNQANNFDQNSNAQYQQQMLLNSFAGNQQQYGGNVQQTLNQNPSDLNNQYQAPMGGYMMPGYGYDQNQMNMVQMNQLEQMPSQNISENEEKKPSEEQIDN